MKPGQRPICWHTSCVWGPIPQTVAQRPGQTAPSMSSGQRPNGRTVASTAQDGPLGKDDKTLLLLRHGETHMNVFLKQHPEKGDGML